MGKALTRIPARLTQSVRAGLLCAALFTATLQAGAQPKTDAACEKQARTAERIAAERDRNVPEKQAVESALSQDPAANRQELMETAHLLYHRFRHMPLEQVAFEFMASCLDDAQ